MNYFISLLKSKMFLVELFLISLIALSIYPKSTWWWEIETVITSKLEYEFQEPIHLIIDSKIKRDFDATWQVLLKRYSENDNTFYVECIANSDGKQRYEKGLQPKKEQTSGGINGTQLSWWAHTNPKCYKNLAPGLYYIETCREVILPVVANRDACVQTNKFKILDVDLPENHQRSDLNPLAAR